MVRDVHGKKYEVSINKLSFRPPVYGVILKDGKVLLSKQWDGYDFPGGGVEIGETIEQALLREVKEETGLDTKVGRLISIYDSFFKLPVSQKFVHSILIYYLCDVAKGNLTSKFSTAEEKSYIGQPEWVSMNKIQSGLIKFYNSANNSEIIEKALLHPLHHIDNQGLQNSC